MTVSVLKIQTWTADGLPARSWTGHGMKTFCKKSTILRNIRKDLVCTSQVKVNIVSNKMARVKSGCGVVSRVQMN